MIDRRKHAKKLRALDVRVHEAVFGGKVSVLLGYHFTPDGGLPRYTSDIAAAWRVVDLMCGPEFHCVTGDPRDGFSQISFALHPGAGNWRCSFWSADDKYVGTEYADTAPLAICLAALEAVSHSQSKPAESGGAVRRP